MKTKLLLVEDEERLGVVLRTFFEKKNFSVDIVKDGEDAIFQAENTKPDVILLDWMLPNMSGIEICRQIRTSKSIKKTPIIFLTAKGEQEDKLKGLDVGADDYVTKPFEPEELYLRIKKLLKLYENINQSELRIEFGDYIFNTKTQDLKINNNEIYLTEGEHNLLLKLINKRNNLVSREELADEEFDESELRKVDVGITRLRQKIEKIAKKPQIIKTIRGKGYMLVCREI